MPAARTLIAVDETELSALVAEVRALREEIGWFKAQVAPSDGLLTTREAAELAGVTRSAVHSWAARGHLKPARREGNRMLFRREDVLSLTEPQSHAR